MLHHHQFDGDPDARQALEDILPVVSQLDEAEAKARKPLLNMNHEHAVRLHVQDLREQVALKAERAGIAVDEFLGLAREELRLRRGGVRRPPQPDITAGDENYAGLSRAVIDAQREMDDAGLSLRSATDRFRRLKKAHGAAVTKLRTYEPGSVA